MVSKVKLSVNVMEDLLLVMSHFILVAFKILCLAFHNLTMIFLGVGL